MTSWNPNAPEHEDLAGTPERHLLRLIAVVVLGAMLVWLILTRSLAASFADTSPETALWLQPNEPRALLTVAKAQLNAALKASEGGPKAEDTLDTPAQPLPTLDRLTILSRLAEAALLNSDRPPADRLELPQPSSPQPDQGTVPPDGAFVAAISIRRLAEQSLAANPFNADALALLGQLAERAGDSVRTDAFMRAAAQLSIRESYAVYWLLQKAQRDNDRAAVLRYADTLLRTRGRARPLVIPILARMAEKDKPDDVAALLKTNPPWRSAFLGQLSQSITDARTPLYLLLGLQGSTHPPTPQELTSYINFLIRKQFHELAYYTRLQFLPTEELAKITPLYNASFEKPLSGLPFDWILSQGSGSTTEIRPRLDRGQAQDNEHALFVEFTQGRSEFPGVTQLTLLGPGTYEFKGKYKGSFVGKRGLIWRISCAGKAPLADSDLLRGDIPQWRDFSVAFTVPANGCRSQQVRLDLDARSASEKMVSGFLWFDDLELNRSASLVPAPEPDLKAP